MTIDPKAAELAKAAKRKAEIDEAAELAAFDLREHYAPKTGNGIADPPMAEITADNFPTTKPDAFVSDPRNCIAASYFEPERYELPEDETATAKPNGGLSDD